MNALSFSGASRGNYCELHYHDVELVPIQSVTIFFTVVHWPWPRKVGPLVFYQKAAIIACGRSAQKSDGHRAVCGWANRGLSRM